MSTRVATAEVQFTAEDSRLHQSFQKIKQESRTIGRSVTDLGTSLDSFLGKRLEQRANATATSIKMIGGAAKLTDAEIKRSLSSLNQWVDKAGKLGKGVSPHVLQTRDALQQINTVATKTPGLFDTVSAKSLALGSAMAGALGGLAWTAVNRLTSEIGEFVSQGAKLPAVQSAFTRLSGSIQQDGTAMLAEMTKSSRGLVSNFDLMQSANNAMLLQLPVTVEAMGEITEIATKLGRAVGKEATPSISEFIEAIGKGSPEILNNFGIIVKAEDAYKRFADRVGASVNSLTAAQKQLAVYELAMEAARQKTKELGDQTLTLGEIAEASWTKVGNVITQATSIANTQIGKLLTNKDEFIRFLKLVAMSGSPGKALAVMDAADRAKAAANAPSPNISLPNELPAAEELKRLLEAANKTATEGLRPLTAAQRQAVNALNDGKRSVQEITAELHKYRIGAGVTEAQVEKLVDQQKAGKKSGDDYAAVLKRIRDAQIPLTDAQKLEVDQLSKIGISHSDIAKKLRVSEIAVKNYADEQKTLNAILSQQLALLPRINRELKPIDLRSTIDRMVLPETLPLVPRSSLINPIPLALTDAEIARAAIAAEKAGHIVGTAAGESTATGWRSAVSGSIQALSMNMGTEIADALGKGIATGDWSNFKREMTDALVTFVSGSIAAALDFIVPGLGTMLQPLIQGVMQKIASLFRDEAHEQTNDIRDQFLLGFGPGGTGPNSGFARFAAQMAALGRSDLTRKVFDARTPEAFEAAVAEVNKVLGDTRAELQRITQEGGLASKELLAFVAATPTDPDSIAFRRSQTTNAGLSAGRAIETGEIRTQEGATAATNLIAGSLAQLRNEFGLTAREALAELAPTIETVRKKLEEAGLTGSAAFADIARLAGIAGDEISGPILDGINHWSAALEAAHNSGLLTQETFAGIATEIMAGRQALLDQGRSADDVNTLMQRDLQTLWQLRKDYNYEVDETTGKLLDEAEAAGVVGDQHRSAMDRAALAMERAALAIENALGRAGEAAEGFGRKVDDATRPRTIKVGYAVQDAPELPGDVDMEAPETRFANRGGLVTSHGLVSQYFGSGGIVRSLLSSIFKPRGIDTEPVMAAPGEGFLNRRAMQMIGVDNFHQLNAGRLPSAFAPRVAAGPAAAPITHNKYSVTIHGDVDTEERAQKLIRAFERVVRKGGKDRSRVRVSLGFDPVTQGAG